MRIAAILAAVFIAGCASAAAQPEQATPVWRTHLEHLQEDRARAHRCLTEGSHNCADEIQNECTGGDGGEGITPAALRFCDWRAIAAWEDEIEDMLIQLREQLHGRDLENLEASQRAWEASMLADISAAMTLYEGGSLAGPAGAHMRAQAVAYRARYLADVLLMLE